VPRLLLCHQPTDGGVGRHVRDLCRGLGARGWEVLLCGPALPDGAGSPARVPLELRRAIAPREDAAAVARLARALGELRPDVVHAHSSKAGAVARLARVAHPAIPVVYTPHGYAFAGHFSSRAQRRLYGGIERALAPLASRVVCVCEAEARLARSVGAPARVRVVHNGVEPADVRGATDPRIAELSRRGPVIGALTLLRPGKGIETLIDAMPRVLARHPSAQVAVCGEGPDLDALRTRARLAGVAGAVRFLGPTSEPLQAMRGFDVLVHPSWAESFPYVILEAMSLGRAIVASDVGGVGEALIDGDSGLLVASREHDALASALIGLLDDPGRRAKMGESARARATGMFSLDAMIERLSRVYDELMASASDTSPRPATPSASEPVEKSLAR
jgi:glycosyltransferase involved in cell wall biosynthesis